MRLFARRHYLQRCAASGYDRAVVRREREHQFLTPARTPGLARPLQHHTPRAYSNSPANLNINEQLTVLGVTRRFVTVLCWWRRTPFRTFAPAPYAPRGIAYTCTRLLSSLGDTRACSRQTLLVSSLPSCIHPFGTRWGSPQEQTHMPPMWRTSSPHIPGCGLLGQRRAWGLIFCMQAFSSHLHDPISCTPPHTCLSFHPFLPSVQTHHTPSPAATGWMTGQDGNAVRTTLPTI